MKMKKLVGVVLAGLMTISLTACGGADSGSNAASSAAAGSSSAAASSAAASSAASGSSAPAELSGDKASKEYEIGFIPMQMNNEYYVTMVNGAQKYAAEHGVKLNVQGCTDTADVEEQLGFIETMISSGVDAIVFVPASSDGLISGVQKCQQAGIPMINVDSVINNDLVTQSGLTRIPHYGTENYGAAKSIGEYAAEKYPGAKTVVLTGTDGQDAATQRFEGFKEGAGDKIEIIASQAADWDVEKGYTAMQNLLTGNPEIDLIYCCNDGMAIGAMRACQEAKRDIPIIGIDALPETQEYIAEGTIAASAAQKPVDMAELAIQACIDVLDGKVAYEDLPDDIDTGITVVDKDNLEEYQKEMAAYAG